MHRTTPSKTAVLVPFAGAISRRCEDGLRELEYRGYRVRRVPGVSAIDQARNQIASAALDEGFEETMWIDSDIGFDPDDVDRLRENSAPIVCGIYVKKNTRSLACQLLPETTEVVFGAGGGLIEILYAATGFLLVRKGTYELVRRRLELPTCSEATAPSVPYFQPLTIERGGQHFYLGEDFAFSERVRQCGIKIIADSRIRLRHYGEYGYSWEDAGSPVTRYQTYSYRVTNAD